MVCLRKSIDAKDVDSSVKTDSLNSLTVVPPSGVLFHCIDKVEEFVGRWVFMPCFSLIERQIHCWAASAVV